MKNHSSINNAMGDTTAADSHLHNEIDELRRRLAALEVGATGQANQTIGRKRHRRATPKRLALMIGGVMLAGATIVFGQSAVDSLFVSKEGNVGVGTDAPKQKLEIRDGDGLIQVGRTAPTLVKGSDNGGAIYFGVDRTGGIDQPTAAIETSWGGGDSNPQLGIGITREFSGRPGANMLLDFSGNTNIRKGLTSRLFVNGGSGNVGIGTTVPGARLDVAGSGWFRGDQGGLLSTAGKGVRVFYDLSDTGQIYSFDYSTSQPKNLALQTPGGNVGIGTTTPQAKLDVAGNMRVGGTLSFQGRYQRDDAAEATYEVSPRYHLSLTAANYAGRTRLIPQQVINDLCGDQDGCEYRLGMTRWDSNATTETAARTAVLYYSPGDGHWRTTLDGIGVDGNNATQHVFNGWDTCYFTDGPYLASREQGDSAFGMYLLVWTGGYGNAGRTCELTLID